MLLENEHPLSLCRVFSTCQSNQRDADHDLAHTLLFTTPSSKRHPMQAQPNNLTLRPCRHRHSQAIVVRLPPLHLLGPPTTCMALAQTGSSMP